MGGKYAVEGIKLKENPIQFQVLQCFNQSMADNLSHSHDKKTAFKFSIKPF